MAIGLYCTQCARPREPLIIRAIRTIKANEGPNVGYLIHLHNVREISETMYHNCLVCCHHGNQGIKFRKRNHTLHPITNWRLSHRMRIQCSERSIGKLLRTNLLALHTSTGWTKYFVAFCNRFMSNNITEKWLGLGILYFKVIQKRGIAVTWCKHFSSRRHIRLCWRYTTWSLFCWSAHSG